MDRSDHIRQRAHQIWEADGQPEGREADHWKQAEEQLRDEGMLDEFGIPDELPDLTSPSEDASPGTGHTEAHAGTGVDGAGNTPGLAPQDTHEGASGTDDQVG